MSWTDVFPVLTDEMVADFEEEATDDENAELESWFGVKKVLNRQDCAHVVATSLFWKNIRAKDPELPPLDAETFESAVELGLVKRFVPREHYLDPLVKAAKELAKSGKDACLRVYLADDLQFLIDELVEAGCEVRVMRSSSIRHNPGAMWRFLALGERGKLVTIIDSDSAGRLPLEIGRTEAMAKAGLRFWRVPVFGDYDDKGRMGYRPVLACQFGSMGALPIKRLMKALLWHRLRGTMPILCSPPDCGEREMTGTDWPDYGFDEWFLLSAVYPRVAQRGVLTFVPAVERSRMLPLDIEYTTWANPRSEIVYFDGGGAGCCGPADAGRANQVSPKARVSMKPHDVIAYTYPADCGLGEAAARNIEAMRSIGLTVEHRMWSGAMIAEPALRNPNQVYYHHWHPQPSEIARKWPKKVFGKAQHISYLAYEADQLPPEFSGPAKHMAELWTPSNYCKKIFESLGKDVHVIPHAVPTVDEELRRLPGSRRGRPLSVLFLFDAWSRLPRKNPEAVLRVFRRAFKAIENVRLVIKAHHLSADELASLHRQCGRDHWIKIINDFIPEPELDRLFEESDMVLSLQRSEGFGLNLARAVSKGVPVVTTGYGGHLDFCRRNVAFLVPFEMEEAGAYGDPWYQDGRWGDPDEDAAVVLVRKVSKMVRSADPELELRRQLGLDLMAKGFSCRRLEQKIRARLRVRIPHLSRR